MQIEVMTKIDADPQTVWNAWNDPEAIKKWNAASDDWHTTSSQVDLRPGGRIVSRMEAKDGSMGFDFAATYTKVEPPRLLAFELDDGRKVVVEFEATDEGVVVRERFDAETQHDPDFQRQGWQAILDSFARYVEAQKP